MPRRPPWPPACTCGTPASGGESVPSRETRRRRPARSVTSMPPSGRSARPHGCSRPLATTVTRAESELASGCGEGVDCAATSSDAAKAIRPAQTRTRLPSRTIAKLLHARMLGAMVAAEHPPVFLEPVPDDANAAMLASRGDDLNRALDAVEGV